MQFSDTSAEKNGLLQECESLIFGDNYGAITNNDDVKATITRFINNGVNRVASLIQQADGRWQYDDTNKTDYPIGVTDLTTDQQDYPLDVTHLKILRVEVKDEQGNWSLLSPIDEADVYDQSLTDFLKSSGQPQYYDKTANSIFLYPKPDYTQAASLKVFFQRPPSYFTTTDTTNVPGFNSLYHRLVALIASRDYAVAKSMPVAKDLAELVKLEEQALQDDYSLRNKDEHARLTVKRQRFN